MVRNTSALLRLIKITGILRRQAFPIFANYFCLISFYTFILSTIFSLVQPSYSSRAALLITRTCFQNPCSTNNSKEYEYAAKRKIFEPAPSYIPRETILKERNATESINRVTETQTRRSTDYAAEHNDREVEKERLAYIFATSPQFFHRNYKQYRRKNREENDRENQHCHRGSCFEKENTDPIYNVSAHGIHCCDMSAVSEYGDQKVRFYFHVIFKVLMHFE